MYGIVYNYIAIHVCVLNEHFYERFQITDVRTAGFVWRDEHSVDNIVGFVGGINNTFEKFMIWQLT